MKKNNMSVSENFFGQLSCGSEVKLFTVKNKDMTFSVTNFGCTITSLFVPSKNGKCEDIVLGYSTLDGYLNKGPYFGAFIGRFANRINKGNFSLNGVEYQLEKNDGLHNLHGGFLGYDKMLFDAKPIETSQGIGVHFTRTSPDGEQGFPGNVQLDVTYLLSETNDIIMNYKATTDKPTPINLTNHSYFNLTGNFRKSILDHELLLNADKYIPVDKNLIPTGEIFSVENTPFNFKKIKSIGAGIANISGGYDHCYVVNPSTEKLSLAAKVYEPISGRKLTLLTNQLGMQFYSGNFLAGFGGKYGQIHQPHQGFCLETQVFPDSPNQKNFPSCILNPNETYTSENIFSFSW
ncbi:MAG: aldose epimerase family protein [Treponemataceae bacterium]